MRTTSQAMAISLTLFIATDTLAQTITEFESPVPKATGNFGLSVAPAGDMNDDGHDDFIIAAPFENGDGPLAGGAGRLYVVDGATRGFLWNIGVPPFLGQRYGTGLAGGVDVSGDGVEDIIAGSLSERVLVFSGATGDTTLVLVHPNGLFGTQFGVEVAAAGDYDGNGTQDIVVAAFDEDVDTRTRAGRVYVFGGPDGDLLDTLESPLPEDGQFGVALASAGDLNGDGRDDLIIGAHLDRPGGLSDAGRAYVFNAATGDTFFTLQAPVPTAAAQFGHAVGSMGDVNGDSLPELIVGAHQDNTVGFSRSGRVYVYDGATGALIYELDSPTPDFNGFFGEEVAGIGDFDGDGVSDLVVGAYTEDEGGVNGSGRAHVFSGATGDWVETFVSPNLENFGRFGIAVGAAGDVNGDGRADVIVGAGLEATDGLNDAGRAYLFTAASPVGAPPSLGAVGPELLPNLPNPFNPRTEIRFRLHARTRVRLSVFDSGGRRVAELFDGVLDAGLHTVPWHAAKAASGVYHYELIADGRVRSGKATLLK